MSLTTIASTVRSMRSWLFALLVFAALAIFAWWPRYSLVVISADLPAIDPFQLSCATWDCAPLPRSGPDPYVTVTPSAPGVRDFRTSTRRDTLAPQWNQVVIENQTVDVLTRPIALHVVDQDDETFNIDDTIARFTLQLTREQLRPGRIVLTTPVGARTATLTLEVR